MQWLLIGHWISEPISDWAETCSNCEQSKKIHHPLALWHIMLERSSHQDHYRDQHWPMRSQHRAELTNERPGLCSTLHPAGQWLSGVFMPRLYYLYQLWWIMYTCGGCPLIVQSLGFQNSVPSICDLSVSWETIYFLSDEGIKWWLRQTASLPSVPCTWGSGANYR